MDSKESSRDSRERSRSDHSSKSRESSQSGSRSESREKSSKSESRSSKSEYSKSRSDSKHSSSKSDSPDKKSKHDQSQPSDTDRDKSRQNTSPGEPEHREPIKLKLSLSQIRSKSKISSAVPTGSYTSSHVTDDSNDSATSYEDYEETRKRTKSRKDGSSKKKKNKDKSKKSKSSTVDPDTLAPPELELMETGESTQISEAEASLLTDPEPLALQEDTMDLSTDSLPGGSTPYQDSEEIGSQQMARMCAFCACGERSLLGQGDMDRYDPTLGYNAFRKSTLKSSKKPSSEVEEKGLDKGPKPLTSRRNRAPLKTGSVELKTLRQPNDDLSEGFDELATVGYPEDTDLSAVIEPSGHMLAHHCCAAWSEGVLQTEDFMLQYVDKAVVMGLSKKCSYCLRYGATINCRYSKCNKIFHYPCASAGGCFQDIKSLSLLCPEHTDEAQTIAGEEALCVVCNIVGNIHEQLFCTSCGHHYHGNCLHPPVEVNPIVRAGWQCPDCKICQMCRQPGDDSKMLVCDMCDKGYHTFCLKPVMTTIPKNGWKCKNCRVCEDCGSRTPGSGRSSRWHLNYTVCDSCYQQRNKGLSCPLCGKAYRHFSQKAMVQCNHCKKLVHSECDDTIDAVLLHQVKNEEPTDYMCTMCRNRDPEMDMPDFPVGTIGMGMIEDSSDSMMMQKTGCLPSGEILDDYGEDSQHTSDFLLNDDSLSSIDIDFNLLEKMSPTYTMPSREGEVSHGKGKLVAMARKKMSLIAAKAKNRQLAPEKRKRLLTFGEKRRAPKPKIGGSLSALSSAKKSSAETDDDDDDHPNSLILVRKDDSFVLNQDVCKSCGSFGRSDEGRLIVCTQCGQCYHPYCANIKVTKIVIQKGWRCLDCTVCEGCGQPHDEGRLLLCDECDISYHTYCLDPPLDHVPKGTWKCKWCVICLICGSTNPGFGCQWQRNYTHCGPCHSKISCPVCRMRYHEEELIIQCVQCDRWLHAFCDGIHNEDDAERAADFGYHCIFCRPRTGQPGPLPPPPLPPSPPMIEKYLPLPLPLPPPPPKEPDPPRFYLVDGILLSTAGRAQIEGIKMEAPKIKRHRRWGKKPEGWDEKREGEDFKSPDEGGPDVELGQTPPDPQANKQVLEAQAMALVADEKKQKKKRNNSRLGVGGFVVKPRFKPRAKRQQSLLSDGMDGLEGMPGIPRPLEGEEGFPALPLVEDEKPRKRRQGVGQGRRKSQLQENFPSYMQEAFFGREILDTSKDRPLEGLKALESDEEKSPTESPKSMEVKEESEIAISSEPLLQQISEKQKQAAEMPSQHVPQTPVPTEATANEEEDLDFDIDVDIEDEFIDLFGDELLQEEMQSADVSKAKDRHPETDNLDLPHLDEKSIPDIDSMLSEGLEHIDSKTTGYQSRDHNSHHTHTHM